MDSILNNNNNLKNCLMYHSFSKKYFNRYSMDIEQFKNHSINNNYILTYDDGSESLYNYRDVLYAKGKNQLIFIRTDKINKSNYLTSSQIHSISNNISIQSHSYNHENHFYLNDEQIKEQGIKSKNIIEDITGSRVSDYSFPGGYWSLRCIKILAENGYRNFFTSIPIFFRKKIYFNGIYLNIFGRVEVFSPGYKSIDDYFKINIRFLRLLRHLYSFTNAFIRSKA